MIAPKRDPQMHHRPDHFGRAFQRLLQFFDGLFVPATLDQITAEIAACLRIIGVEPLRCAKIFLCLFQVTGRRLGQRQNIGNDCNIGM